MFEGLRLIALKRRPDANPVLVDFGAGIFLHISLIWCVRSGMLSSLGYRAATIPWPKGPSEISVFDRALPRIGYSAVGLGLSMALVGTLTRSFN